METYPRVYSVIKWTGVLFTFKMWRMTYSYFLRQKQFLVIYQKKKFKKFIISSTMLGMILVELPNVIGAVLGMSSLQFNQQVAWSVVDAFMISCLLICLSLCEIAIIDKIMRT
jgi:cation transporter-like permease